MLRDIMLLSGNLCILEISCHIVHVVKLIGYVDVLCVMIGYADSMWVYMTW